MHLIVGRTCRASGLLRCDIVTSTNEARAPLRFVILCESLRFERWQAECVRQAVESGAAVPVGVVLKTPAQSLSLKGKWNKRWRDRKVLAWRLFDRLFVRPFSQAVKLVDLEDMLAEVPKCCSTPVKVGKYSEKLDEPSSRFVRDLQPDFVLRLGFGILKGEILSVARFGLWSYHHGNPAKFRGQPPGFWEIFTGSRTAGVILQVLGTKLDAGRILHQGEFAVTPQSYAKTRDTLYFGSTPFVARTCRNILANGWQEQAGSDTQPLGPVYSQPATGQVIRFASLSLRARIAAFRGYRMSRQSWNCAVVPEPIHVVAGLAGRNRQRSALCSAIWMAPEPHEFFADPFGCQIGPSAFRIFFERFDWRTNRGDIATTVFDGETFQASTTALKTETHLSYPFLIKSDGEWVLIPEHSEARNVSSFLFDHCGVANERRAIFHDTDLIDTTFLKFDGKVWAFALMNDCVNNTQLYLFVADHIDGPWRFHPLNPIKSDVRSARPAGTPFVHEGKLYRPAQDCSRVYGGAVTVNEIITMTETDYREIEVSKVEPLSDGLYNDGLHTLSALANFTLIDGARRVRG
jgi:hypothetical protein